jgi:hypothetical protein
VQLGRGPAQVLKARDHQELAQGVQVHRCLPCLC